MSGPERFEIPHIGPRFPRGPQLPELNLAALGRFVLLALIGLAILSSWFQVGPESVGVVLRFGAFSRTVEPGLHFKLPLGIERVYKVETERQHKQEFGFRTREPGITTTFETGSFQDESLMLTGDLNVAVVEWTVQYRIVDAKNYLFRVRSVEETLRYISEAVMREIVGDRTVNEVITVGRAELAVTMEQHLQKLCDQYETGLKIEQVILQDVTPPDEVKPSFNEVNQAQQERERTINEARAEYNREVPESRGTAQQTLQQAEGYAIDRVNRARGDAARFEVLVGEYRKAPEVTRRRLYVETMAAVLPRVGRKVVVDREAGSIIPLVGLGEGTLQPLAPGAAAGTGGGR